MALTFSRKTGESVHLNLNGRPLASVTIRKTRKKACLLSIQAPAEVDIWREEIAPPLDLGVGDQARAAALANDRLPPAVAPPATDPGDAPGFDPAAAWIQTFSGRQFHPLAPRASEVVLEDIAHALGNMCRFNGHCSRFYSVAEHSFRVAELAVAQRILAGDGWGGDLENGDLENVARLALLHDAAEAYLPDITRPVKPAWPGFQRIEDRLLGTILHALGVQRFPGHVAAVKYADDVLLATEARDLMAAHPFPWAKLPTPLPEPIDDKGTGHWGADLSAAFLRPQQYFTKT